MKANEPLRAAMKRQRLAMRAMLPRLRERARAQVAKLRDTPAYRRMREAAARRRRRTLTASSLLLLLLLLIDCAGPIGTKKAIAKATPTPTPKAVAVKPTPRPPLAAKLATQKRPGYELDALAGPDWLDEFRLQVAARSPRLARCFNGSDRGGALRWTVSVDARTGAVADHELEPLGGGAMIRAEQRACAIKALSDPPYLVQAPQVALPNRVSLVLEF